MRLIYTLCSLLVCSAAVAQDAAKPQAPAAPPAAAPAQPAPVAPVRAAANVSNAVTRAAVQRGVLSCAARINQVTNYVGFDDAAGALLMAPGQQPDASLTPVVLETIVEGKPVLVSTTFAPNQANGCGATFDAVAYWPQKCDEVATKRFASLKKVSPIRRDIAVLDGGAALKVFLMPAGAGCISIKKEIVL